MKISVLALAAGLASAPLALAADAPATATVALKTATGASAGTATLTEAPNGVLIRIQATGLPSGWHGLHFHEKGDCSAAGFTSAGGHVHDKPSVVHGLMNPDANEAGDLPNLYVDGHGAATVELFSTYVSLGGTAGRPGLADADGSAIVIHASPDDYRSQPIGGAGARIACGVIAKGG